jgi:2'-5' RNA ligase
MRLFVGVEIDDTVRQAAASATDDLRRCLTHARADVHARWVEPGNLHATVWFIGEVNDERGAEIRRALAAPVPTRAFDLGVGGFGAFPPSGPPRVIWLGVTTGSDAMAALYDAVRGRLEPLGFEAEKRRYSAHVTVARVKDVDRGAARRVRDALAATPADCGACRVEAATLFRSQLSPRGSQYEPLLRVPLS